MAHPAPSAITMALTSPSSSVGMAGLPGRKAAPSFAAGAKRLAGMPPTPPNSLSPNLPAHLVRGAASSPPPMHIDQDVDLQDAVDHARAQDQPQLAPVPLSEGALSGLDTSQAITPFLLARDHLPAIILGHGPVPIRHIIGCLTQSVPGFGRIPAAKARRIVGAALELRSGGGRDGSVVFEKVGWGRWNAYKRGEKPPPLADKQTSSSCDSYGESKLSPPASDFGSYAASHSGSAYPINKQRSAHAGDAHIGWGPSSMPSVDEEGLEHMSMSEHEADNMSLDGSESDSATSDSAGDETESEDWAAMGVDAIRKSSIPTAAPGSIRRNYNLLCIPSPVYNRRFSHSSGVRKNSQTMLAKSAPAQRPTARTSHSSSFVNKSFNRPFNVLPPADRAMDVDMTPAQAAQEREAILALLTLGST